MPEQRIGSAVIYTDDDRSDFNVPSALPIEKALDKAYIFLDAAKKVIRKATELSALAESETPPDPAEAMLAGVDAEFREKRAEALVDFAIDTMKLATPEELTAASERYDQANPKNSAA